MRCLLVLLKIFYSLLAIILIPCALIKLWWRGRNDIGYRQRWAERLAIQFPSFSKPVIWFHAVSVGETIAAKPLLEALLDRYGANYELLITNGTLTGSRCSQALFAHRVKHCYLPYDGGLLSRRFIKNVKPILAMMMETEVWPSILDALYQANIPTLLINARLSAKSARAYQRFGVFFKPLFAGFSCIAAQASADAARFIAVGADAKCVKIAGNIKFNVDVPAELRAKAQQWRQALAPQMIWLAASTHEGEEAVILKVYQQLRGEFPNLRLWLAPRHPARCEQIAQLALGVTNTVVLRSALDDITALSNDAILIIDTLGELLFFYAVADIALVGGSLGTRGGHNILEPAAVGTLIMTGPNMHNFATIFEQFKVADALVVVHDEATMVAELTRLLKQPELCQAMRERATRCFLSEQQALATHLAIIDNYL